MSSNRLNIISVENNDPSESRAFRPRTNRQEAQAKFEKLWHRHPEKFDPVSDCMGRERVSRTFKMMDSLCPVSEKKTVDLGCGSGVLSRKLREKRAKVTAVDIAKNALEKLRKEGDKDIEVVQDFIPHTKLEDESFDIVFCTDLIGYIKPKEHRLFISELARLVKKDGFVVCSTPIDIDSEDALERFTALAETELTIVKWKLSHHRYFIRWLDFFKAPIRFAKARADKAYREEALSKRLYLSRWWFKINTIPLIGDLWSLLKPLTKPLYQWFLQNRSLMIVLEKICRFLHSDSGISHAIFIAQRRPLVETPPVDSPPIEMKKKKTVWE